LLFFNAKQVQNIFLEIGWDSNEYHKFMTKCERETPKPRNLWRRPLCPMPSSVATVDRRGRRSTIVHLLSPFLFQTVLVWCSFWSEKKTRTLSCCLNLRIFRMRCYAATPLFSLKFTATQVETQSVQSINYNSLFSGATVFFGSLPGILGVWPLPGEISWCFLKGKKATPCGRPDPGTRSIEVSDRFPDHKKHRQTIPRQSQYNKNTNNVMYMICICIYLIVHAPYPHEPSHWLGRVLLFFLKRPHEPQRWRQRCSAFRTRPGQTNSSQLEMVCDSEGELYNLGTVDMVSDYSRLNTLVTLVQTWAVW